MRGADLSAFPAPYAKGKESLLWQSSWWSDELSFWLYKTNQTTEGNYSSAFSH